MQRMAPNSVPASKPMPVKPEIIEEASPALLMARRIRSEQGVEQLKRFLNSMEPFVAPAERMKIAESMGVRLNPSGPKAEPQAAKPSPGAGMPNIPSTPATGQSQGNPMSLLSSMLGQKGMGAANGGGLDPMMLMQMMNGMKRGK